MSMKDPLTLAGIEPATFRFVTQHLNHCATAVPEENLRDRNTVTPRPGQGSTAIAIKWETCPVSFFCLTVITWFWKYHESTLIIKLTCQNAYYNYCRTYMTVRLCT